MIPPPHRDGRNGTTGPVFDYAGTLDRLGGDRELFTELVQFFFEDSAKLHTRLHTAADAKDAKGIEHASHALKGLFLNFGARHASRAAETIEEASRQGRLAEALEELPQLDASLTALRKSLEACGTTGRV